METMRSRSTAPRPDRRTKPSLLGAKLRSLSDEALDHRISAGLDAWSEIQEELLATGGMPPSRRLAGRVVNYLEGAYWLAEEARVEAVRRQCSRIRRSADRTQRGWSLA